jgi:hypothetical protein
MSEEIVFFRWSGIIVVDFRSYIGLVYVSYVGVVYLGGWLLNCHDSKVIRRRLIGDMPTFDCFYQLFNHIVNYCWNYQSKTCLIIEKYNSTIQIICLHQSQKTKHETITANRFILIVLL